MIIYLIAAVALVMGLLGTSTLVSHSNAKRYQAERDQAYTVNKGLADSLDGIKADCRKTQTTLDSLRAADARRKAASKAALEQANKLATAQRDVVDKLIAQSQTAENSNANCENARVIGDALARDRVLNAPHPR